VSEIGAILDLANKLTVPAALLLALYAIVFGKIPTSAQLAEVRDRAVNAETEARKANERANALPTPGELHRLEQSEQRAWDQAKESKEALAQNTATLERLADAIEHLKDTIDAFVRVRRGDG
jgi:chromosome segregation ATPase